MIPNPRRLRLSPNSPGEISEDSMVQCSKNPFGISSCCYFIPWISWRAMSIEYLFLIRTETIEITKRIGATRRPLKNKCLKLVQSRHMVILKKNLISEKNAWNSCYTLVISLVLTFFFWTTKIHYLLFVLLSAWLRISLWHLQWLGDSIHLLLAILRRQGCLPNRLNVLIKTNASTKESPKYFVLLHSQQANVSCLQT